jgi:hypothetical protein
MVLRVRRLSCTQPRHTEEDDEGGDKKARGRLNVAMDEAQLLEIALWMADTDSSCMLGNDERVLRVVLCYRLTQCRGMAWQHKSLCPFPRRQWGEVI